MKKFIVIFIIVAVTAVAGVLGFMFLQTRGELADTRLTLDANIAKVNGLTMDLEQTKSTLSETQTDLDLTAENLEKTSGELKTTQDSLAAATTERDKFRSDYWISTARISDLEEQLDTALLDYGRVSREITLYQDTFGSVYEDIQPGYIVNNSLPPSWYESGPFTATWRAYHLVNNPDAKNPTYAALLAFLRIDKTDTGRYVSNYYMCGNYAETLHNNAEAAGIRAAIVFINFTEGPGHAINAFVTQDKGLVYIDVTGTDTIGPTSMDCVVNKIKINSTYQATFLFPSGFVMLPNNHKITNIQVYW